eukprot:5975684-Pyramimonas_sp.AAC.1
MELRSSAPWACSLASTTPFLNMDGIPNFPTMAFPMLFGLLSYNVLLVGFAGAKSEFSVDWRL